jgi:CheY-like chemotaxis protein
MCTCKILMADDDPDDRWIIQDALETLKSGELISFAVDGEKVLIMLEDQYKINSVPDLIVLDLNMPLINGTQTLERVKKDQRFRHIPVIIYSTSINPIERKKCIDLGAEDYITKPLSFDESIQIARVFLGYCVMTS